MHAVLGGERLEELQGVQLVTALGTGVAEAGGQLVLPGPRDEARGDGLGEEVEAPEAVPM